MRRPLRLPAQRFRALKCSRCHATHGAPAYLLRKAAGIPFYIESISRKPYDTNVEFTPIWLRTTLKANFVTSFLPQWLNITSAIAIGAFCISVFNLCFTWQGRRLAREQERRRLPQLVPTLINGYFQNDKKNGGRVYAFLVTVTNPTDSNNAIAGADLSITYLTKDRMQMTIKIRANETLASNFVKGQNATLAIPASISAHNALSGWLCFHIPAPLLVGIDIESYRLILTDTHRENASIAPILIQEYRDET